MFPRGDLDRTHDSKLSPYHGQNQVDAADSTKSTKADHLQLQLLYKVLCLPEFMVKFRRRLDYDRFNDRDYFMLPVKSCNA